MDNIILYKDLYLQYFHSQFPFVQFALVKTVTNMHYCETCE